MTYVLNTPAGMAAGNAPRPGLWQRFGTALIESRRRAALRELRAQAVLIGETGVVLGGYPQTPLGEDAKLPFNR